MLDLRSLTLIPSNTQKHLCFYLIVAFLATGLLLVIFTPFSSKFITRTRNKKLYKMKKSYQKNSSYQCLIKWAKHCSSPTRNIYNNFTTLSSVKKLTVTKMAKWITVGLSSLIQQMPRYWQNKVFAKLQNISKSLRASSSFTFLRIIGR